MSIKPWEAIDEEQIADMRIFDVTRRRVRNPRNGKERAVACIETRDWVNIIAVTANQHVVLVRQWRHGTEAFTLEIPGGLVDEGEHPREAAIRELREETGYGGGRVTDLGVVEPNPAFLNNRCYTYLVEGCVRTQDQELDDGEDIEVVTEPLGDVAELIATGEITHALVVCGFWWLALKRPGLLPLDVADDEPNQPEET